MFSMSMKNKSVQLLCASVQIYFLKNKLILELE